MINNLSLIVPALAFILIFSILFMIFMILGFAEYRKRAMQKEIDGLRDRIESQKVVKDKSDEL